MVEYYFEFVLERKVATRMDRGGSDTAVCRARTEDEMDYIRELFCDGVAEDGCDNCPLCGYWCPFGGCRETGEAHEVKRFVVVPEPFPLTADGRTWEEAKENLMDGFKQAVLEGFKDAVEGGIGFTVIPLADGVNAAKAVKGGMR